MSLSTNVSNLATRIATEAKALRTLINGNAADLSSLTTTAKGNLVLAINEVAAASGSAAGIDDETTSTSSTWSSTKTAAEIGTASTADRARANHTGTQSADSIVDGTTNHAFTAADDTKLAGIATGATANSADATLLARANHTGSQAASTISDFATAADARVALLVDDVTPSTSSVYSSSKTDSQIAAEVAALVDSSPGNLDTLNELAAALGDDPNFATTVSTALGNRVRTDTAAQGLDSTQQGNARTNIAAASAAALTALTTAVGDTDANYVTTFETGLV